MKALDQYFELQSVEGSYLENMGAKILEMDLRRWSNIALAEAA